VQIQQASDSWQTIDFFPAAVFLINELYARAGQTSALKQKHIELLLRLTESVQLMTRYLQARQGDDRLVGDSFIESEQSLLYGHWLHPKIGRASCRDKVNKMTSVDYIQRK